MKVIDVTVVNRFIHVTSLFEMILFDLTKTFITPMFIVIMYLYASKCKRYARLMTARNYVPAMKTNDSFLFQFERIEMCLFPKKNTLPISWNYKLSLVSLLH